MNSFEVLGLEKRLVLSEEDLKARYDALSKERHPDAGGTDEGFAELQRAFEDLKTLTGRIRAFLGEDPGRGSLPGEVMENFGEVAGTLERVENFLSEREKARSHLTRALLDQGVPGLKRQVEETLELVLSLRANFEMRASEEDEEALAEVYRGLVFLDKWEGQLKGASGRLFQALMA